MSWDKSRNEKIKDRERQAKLREKRKAERKPDTHAIDQALTASIMAVSLRLQTADKTLTQTPITLAQIAIEAEGQLMARGYDQNQIAGAMRNRLQRLKKSIEQRPVFLRPA
jgi:hypothetical protein